MTDKQLENIEIGMLRSDFEGLPRLPLPDGYTMRLFRPGDEDLWVDIIRSSEEFLTIEDTHFEKEFGPHRDLVPERMHFLLDPQGREIGTATAWFSENHVGDGQTYGLIHWVAIRPEAQGRGLCKPMLCVILDKLAGWYDRVALGTSSGRLVAIKCYLDFGFVPNMLREQAHEGWSEVRAHLNHPSLTEMPELQR